MKTAMRTASSSATTTSWSVCTIARLRRGQMGRSVTVSLPNFLVTTSRTQ